MVELELLADGGPHIVCRTCVARNLVEGKYYCDEGRLEHKPLFCPLDSVKKDQKAAVILRSTLRGLKKG